MKSFRALCLASVLAGCAGPRPAVPPLASVEAQERWRGNGGTPIAIDGEWWRQFGDPVLDALVAKALERNTDLLIAGTKVAEARAQFRQAASRLLPSVGIDGRGGRSRSVNLFGVGVDQTQAAGELTISYEVDLFGRISATSDAARKAFQASEFARDATRITLTATVVSGYALLRGLDEQLLLVEETVKSRELELGVIRRRTDAGYGSKLELAQAQAALEAAARLVPATRRSISQQENALSVLVGDMPGEILRGERLESLLRIAVPGALPSELVRRRPDIAKAEMRLASTDRSLDAARARFLPTLQLSGTVGGVASTLLGNPISLFSLGGSILAPLFQGGELRAQADASAARRDAAAFAYRGTVLTAFEEVENAMTGVARLSQEQDALDRQVVATATALDLARRRYRSGYSSYLEQLDAERSLLEVRLQALSNRSERVTAVIALYRSLGGGWTR
ncbi:efflux transporter outer membrane subunit [Novosphingobium sp.]|uniref:efflux transporter outer membrane subunit n=1 Tax=Novosphingobium sp. TaxID=1874826 RepID=UPI003D6CB9FA